MKAYFIAGGYMGCNYVRVLMPMWENGYMGNVMGLSTKNNKVDNMMHDLQNVDVVVFHRPELKEYGPVAKQLRQMGKKIVFDNDDTFKLHRGHPFYKINEIENADEKMTKINKRIDDFISSADLVTTTTKTLANEYRELNDNVAILPNCVNPEDWSEPKRNEGEKIRIGLSGSTAYSTDFEVIQDYIRELDDRNDVQFVLFGLASPKERVDNPKACAMYEDEYKFWDSLRNKEHMAWVPMHQYFDTLNNLELDLLLIPRQENNFNRCKSNVKFLEAAMCEIPVVASAFKNGPYEELDGVIGHKVYNGEKGSENWKVVVDALIADKKLRRKMGRNAREYVLKNYDIKDHAHKWEEAYNKLLI